MQRRRSGLFVELDLRNLGVRVTPFLRKLSVMIVFKMKLWIRRTRLNLKLRVAQAHYDAALRARCGQQLFAVFRQRARAVRVWRRNAARAAFREWRAIVNRSLYQQELACGKLQSVSLDIVASRCFLAWSLFSRLVGALHRHPSASAAHLQSVAQVWPLMRRFEVCCGCVLNGDFFASLANEKVSCFREEHLLRRTVVQWRWYCRLRLNCRADKARSLAWRSTRLTRGAFREWTLALRLEKWKKEVRRRVLAAVFAFWLLQAKRGARDRHCVQVVAQRQIDGGKRTAFERWKRRWNTETTLTSRALVRISRDSRIVNFLWLFALLADLFNQVHGPDDLNAQWLRCCATQAKCFLKWKAFVGWTKVVHAKFGAMPCVLSVALVDVVLRVPSLSVVGRWLRDGAAGIAHIESLLLENQGDEWLVSARAAKELNPAPLLHSVAAVTTVDWTAPVARKHLVWEPTMESSTSELSRLSLTRGEALAARRCAEIRAISGLNCRFAAAALAGSPASSLGFLPSAVTFSMGMFERKRRKRRKSARSADLIEAGVRTGAEGPSVSDTTLPSAALHTDCVPTFAGEHVIAVSAAVPHNELEKPLFPRSGSVDSVGPIVDVVLPPAWPNVDTSPPREDSQSPPLAVEPFFPDIASPHPTDVEIPGNPERGNDDLQVDEQQYVIDGAWEAMQSHEAVDSPTARTTSPAFDGVAESPQCAEEVFDVFASLTSGVRSIQLFAFGQSRSSCTREPRSAKPASPTSESKKRSVPSSRVSFASFGGRNCGSPVLAAGFPARVLKRSRRQL